MLPYSESVYDGPRASPFSVFAVTLCQLLTIDARELARVLAVYPASDSAIVTEALTKEYNGLVESLKMNKDSMRDSRMSNLRESSSGNDSPSPSPSPVARTSRMSKFSGDKATLTSNLESMERRTNELIKVVDSLQNQANMLPTILGVLTKRIAEPQASPAGPSSPPPDTDRSGGSGQDSSRSLLDSLGLSAR